MDAGAEADGDDQAEQRVSLGRVGADVLLEEGHDRDPEADLHRGEEPPGPDQFGRRQRRPDVDDEPRERGLLTEAQQVVADRRGDAVERVAEDGEGADAAGRADVPDAAQDSPRRCGDGDGDDRDGDRGDGRAPAAGPGRRRPEHRGHERGEEERPPGSSQKRRRARGAPRVGGAVGDGDPDPSGEDPDGDVHRRRPEQRVE